MAVAGVSVPHASGAAVVCGKCNVPIELHPVDICPYEYPIVRDGGGKAIGYFMLAKKPQKEKEHGIRQKTG